METGINPGVSEPEKRRRLSEVYLKLASRAVSPHSSESAGRIMDNFEKREGSLKGLLEEPVTFYREDGEGETSCHLESDFSFVENTPEWTEMQKDPVGYFESLPYITRADIKVDTQIQNIRELRDVPYDRSKVKIAEFGGKKVVVKRAVDSSTAEFERALVVENSGIPTPSAIGYVRDKENVYLLFEFVDNAPNVNEWSERSAVKDASWYGHSIQLLDMNSDLCVDIKEGNQSPLQPSAKELYQERAVLDSLDRVVACLDTDEQYVSEHPYFAVIDLRQFARVLLQLDTLTCIPVLSHYISVEKTEAIKRLLARISSTQVNLENIFAQRDSVIDGIDEEHDVYNGMFEVGKLIPHVDVAEGTRAQYDRDGVVGLWTQLKQDPDYLLLTNVEDQFSLFTEKKAKWEREARRTMETAVLGAEVTLPFYAFIDKAIEILKNVGLPYADINFRNVLIRLDENGKILTNDQKEALFMLIDFET